VQALAFDFDGLILDTETPELHVWEAEFREHGVELPEGYWTQVIGRGAEQNIERPSQLLARLAADFRETPERQAVRKARVLELIDLNEIRPGIESLLDRAIAEGLPVGIASSSKHDWVDHYLVKLGLAEKFDAVLCADDVSRAKPFPDLYVELCRRLRAEPAHTMALEDSPNGIAAAKAAGLFTVAVPNGATAGLDLSEADLRIDNLTDYPLSRLQAALMARRN
jgi:HAD superfamily hydrolase (TIGR01509 family)